VREKELGVQLQRIFVREAPVIPLFPGPSWAEYVSTRFQGFPTKENPYAPLAPYRAPGFLLTLLELEPRTPPGH
jgi:peptide/nickel transport system substrate-binding protein